MNSPPEKQAESLDLLYILQFLRAEGFYAAEEALIREIENRCPDGNSPTAHSQPFAPERSQNRHRADEVAASNKEPDNPSNPQQEKQETGGEEDWRARGELPEGAPEALCRASSYDQEAPTYSSSTAETHRPTAKGSGSADGYSDDDDVGYVREYIRGQDAFIAREIDLSDEDASQRGLRLYHKAQAMQGMQQAHDEADHEDRDSSDGQGSSYFSGEVIDRGNSMQSQVSASSRDRGVMEDSRMVTLMDPVNPKPSSPPPSAFVIPPPASPQTSAFSLAAPSAPSSTGPTSHPLSHISSDNGAESTLVHEPSFSPNAAIPDTKVADTATSGEQISEDEQADQSGARQEGIWARGYLDPFGVFGKVFGRKNSGSQSDSPAAKESDVRQLPRKPDERATRNAAQGAPLREAENSAEVQGSAQKADSAAIGKQKTPSVPASATCTSGQDLPIIPEPLIEVDSLINGTGLTSAPAAQSDAESSYAPQTPKAAAKGTDGDSAFSFPVTPPSEPPAAAEPGAVFGTWPSLRNSNRKQGSRGDLASRGSSEYAASGYSTDEGGSQLFSNPESHLIPSCLDLQAGIDSSRDAGVDTAQGTGIETSRDEVSNEPSSSDTEATADFSLQSGGGTAARAVPRSPVSIQPLDMSVSLPAKSGLGLASARKASVSTSPSEDGALQAYMPPPAGANVEPVADISHRSGDLTERTMETAVGGEGSTAGGTASADDYSSVAYRWDEEYLNEKYEMLNLKIIHRRRRTGFEESKDIAIHVNDLIAGRYQVTDFLGSAAFSQAVQALDIKTGGLVCLKIIKNNKDYLDQSLDEIKLLKYVNEHDPNDEHGILQLYDYFYYKEHLFLVCELLRANLYEFQKYNREHGQEPYFTLQRVQSIARQVLQSLAFMHSLDLIHCDLKPENILIKSYSRCEVKVIDLGSSCFTTDHLSSYVQSRSYRAPEVILGLPYHQQVDIWSLGCILAELLSGYVLLQNDSLATLLARLEGILGPIPRWMLRNGRYAHRYYTRNGALYEQSPRTARYELLRPKQTSLKHRVPEADEGCMSFLSTLLTIDPKKRPTAAEALQHPWLQYKYSENLST